MSEGKRVLVITKNDFRAQMDGGSKRTNALVRALADSGWTVDWVAAKPFVWKSESAHAVKWTRLLVGAMLAIWEMVKSPSLSSCKWFSARAAGMIHELAETNDYDVVILEHTQLAAYLKPAKAPGAIVDMHNIESQLLANYARSAGFSLNGFIARFEALLIRRTERRLAEGEPTVATVSDHDATQLRLLAAQPRQPILVAPNGIEEEFFNIVGAPEDIVVFIGHLGWRPNVDAASWLTNTVWPHVARAKGRLELHLIGRDPSPEVEALSKRDDVRLFANVPSVVPHLASAACATAPLLSAGGTRIKILEALAAGVPVVATSLGALGLEHLENDYFAIADDPATFARHVRDLSARRFDREAIRAEVAKYRWPMTLAPIIAEANRRYECKWRSS